MLRGPPDGGHGSRGQAGERVRGGRTVERRRRRRWRDGVAEDRRILLLLLLLLFRRRPRPTRVPRDNLRERDAVRARGGSAAADVSRPVQDGWWPPCADGRTTRPPADPSGRRGRDAILVRTTRVRRGRLTRRRRRLFRPSVPLYPLSKGVRLSS